MLNLYSPFISHFIINLSCEKGQIVYALLVQLRNVFMHEQLSHSKSKTFIHPFSTA